MRTGRQTLATIEEAIARLHGEEGQLDVAMRAAMETGERLRRERGGALRELARVKLDEIMAGRLVRNLDAAERRAVAILEVRRLRIAQITERRAAAVVDTQRAEADVHAAGGAVEAALAKVEARRLEVQNAVQATPRWQAVKARFDAADTVATQADGKAAQSEADLGAKRRPYDEDGLFVYLWRAEFATARYAGGRLARLVDGMLADFIGYLDARPNYAALLEIPVRLREHANERRAAADAVKVELAGLEQEAMQAAGVDVDERTLAEARHRLAAAEATLAARGKVLSDIEQERQAFLSGSSDPAYGEALETIATGDAADDLATLRAEARRTSTQADEALVARIEAIDEDLARIDRETAELRDTAKALADRRLEVEQVRDRFRGAGYDHPQATFGNDNQIGTILAQVLEGVVRSGILWDVIRGGFGTRPPRGRPDFGEPGFQLPFPMPGGGSTGPSGGGWREPESQGGWFPPSGGGRSDDDDDDDGFKTGGSF